MWARRRRLGLEWKLGLAVSSTSGTTAAVELFEAFANGRRYPCTCTTTTAALSSATPRSAIRGRILPRWNQLKELGRRCATHRLPTPFRTLPKSCVTLGLARAGPDWEGRYALSSAVAVPDLPMQLMQASPRHLGDGSAPAYDVVRSWSRFLQVA